MQKRVRTSSTTTYTDYQGGFHYENYGLRFFVTAEGYVNVSAGRYNYVYNYTDHLGNVRLSYTHDRLLGVRVIEENNYYPFGLKHNGYNNISPPNSVYKYKFNGKELQDELGLNVYDFGARNYMPDLGRWANIDPLAEASRRWTPYNYAYNNPVYFIDPDGMQAMSTGYGSVSLETSNIAISFTFFKDIGKGKKGDDLRIKGADAAAAVTALNSDSQLNLIHDTNTGDVSIMGPVNEYSKLSDTDKQLFDIINSSKVVNLTTTRDVTRNGSVFFVGSFNGENGTESFNEINMIQANSLESNGVQTASASVRHEIFEGALSISAINLPSNVNNILQPFVPPSFNQNVYMSSHNGAIAIDKAYKLGGVQSNQLYYQTNGVLWFNPSSSATINSSGWFRLN